MARRCGPGHRRHGSLRRARGDRRAHPHGDALRRDALGRHFRDRTRAAAFGGTTTIIDFAIQSKGKSLREGLDAWHAKADGNCAIDYGFHMIVSDVTESSLKEMDLVVDEGVTSFKLFMAYPGVFYSNDGQILQAMQQASGNGATIMMHAENGIAIDVLVAQSLARGEGDPRFHGVDAPGALRR